jgi:hypothetical protein
MKADPGPKGNKWPSKRPPFGVWYGTSAPGSTTRVVGGSNCGGFPWSPKVPQGLVSHGNPWIPCDVISRVVALGNGR